MSEITFNSDTKQRKLLFSALHFAHPAKMHYSLLVWIVENFTSEGQVLLDPMGGSGTTMLACRLGRNVILNELEPKFVKMQQDNWAKVQTFGAEMGHEMGWCKIAQGDARQLDSVLADVIVSSPPYCEAKEGSGLNKRENWIKHLGDIHRDPNAISQVTWTENRKGNNPNDVGNLPYGSIDAVITSPPYENQIHKGTGEWSESPGGKLLGGELSSGGKMIGVPQGKDYINSEGNIGNLKGQTYLSAMLEVYQACSRVLKPQGLMILVTKNFIRNKQIVRLDEDTIKICEQAGFEFQERHYRKLTTQSFWRTIYAQKYPDAPVLDTEDVLVFKMPL